MNDKWSSSESSYQRYLDLPHKPGSSMTIFTLSERELQSALEAIGKYVIRTSSGKAKIEILHGKTVIYIENSKGMSY